MSERGVARQASAVVAAYRPVAVSEAAGAFACEVVGRACPQSPARARALLFAASRLAAFGESVGLAPRAQVLLRDAVIERFILCPTAGLSPASVRTLRTNLRALGRALEAHPQPLPRPLPRERAKAPYGEEEIEGFLACARAQSTLSRRMRCQALICLGAGAGVIGAELRHIKSTDVICRSGGVLVAVGGKRARIVPVLHRFGEPLLEAAAFAGASCLLGGRSPDRKNLTCEITALFCDPSLPRLEAGRLRSTWLCQAAQAAGLHAFMAAAGVRCSQRLGDIAASLGAPSEQELVALLGGPS